jgi:cyanophycin synthetase
MAPHCPGGVLFFAVDGNNPVLARHRSVGGRAVFVRDGQIIFAEGSHEEIFMSVNAVPLTVGGKISFHVENTLASVAAAWCVGIPLETIRQRAATITADMGKVPGRFNILDIDGATVIVDYGHNVHSLTAVLEVVEKFPNQRRMAVYSTAGDRRDCDMIRQGELLGAAFDRVILYEDHYLRGRAKGEIMGLFRKGVETGSRAKEIIEIVGATKAAEAALNMVESGELLLLQADKIDETMDWIRQYISTMVEQKAAAEELIDEAVAAPALAQDQAVTAKEKLTQSEVGGAVLAESSAAAKA